MSDYVHPRQELEIGCYGNPPYISHEGGLTKRELFAAMAMQGIVASSAKLKPEEFGHVSVAMADYLIKELSK